MCPSFAEFNLNVPRFVDTFEPEPRIEVEDAIAALHDADKATDAAVRRLNELLREIGYAPSDAS